VKHEILLSNYFYFFYLLWLLTQNDRRWNGYMSHVRDQLVDVATYPVIIPCNLHAPIVWLSHPSNCQPSLAGPPSHRTYYLEQSARQRDLSSLAVDRLTTSGNLSVLNLFSPTVSSIINNSFLTLSGSGSDLLHLGTLKIFDWLTWCKIGHIDTFFSSQSLSTVLEKVNITQTSRHAPINQKIP